MPLTPQANDFLSCPICFYHFSYQRKPVTLVCSHTCCTSCLKSLQCCPFDQTPINADLPENEAILGLISTGHGGGHDQPSPSINSLPFLENYGVTGEEAEQYYSSVEHIKQLAVFLKPHQQNTTSLSRPMQRKLISLLHCQIIEGEGRSRAMRNVRSIGERALSELLIKHQDPHSLSANLWAAVRARGCQFLGPAMQEEVLKLVLLALEDGSALSRKVLVMFVVQRLSPHFPHQASKTAIGHVIQLLYRASCFKLTKRDGDSSLMQLKEEYCSYEALRREHDTQIVSIALEAGLRISPDQWSSLLYGDTGHKSHMQSIIDKLQSPQSFNQSIQELVIALQRTGDPANLSILREHFERLAQIESSPAADIPHPSHEELASFLDSCKIITFQLVDFLEQLGSGSFRPGRSSSFAAAKPRPTRPKPFIMGQKQQQGGYVSPKQMVPTYSENPNHFQFPKRMNPAPRPMAAVQPSRIGQSSPGMIHEFPAPAGVPMVGVPHFAMPPHMMIPAPPPSINPVGPSQQPTKAYQLTAVPVAIVDALGNPTGTDTIVAPQPVMTNQAVPVQVIPTEPQLVAEGAALTPTLSFEDDQFVPFADRPFVSKYGPISKNMSLINTPTLVGSSNALTNCGGTHSTNVVLGRTAVPSLTFIQPLQQLVLTTTTIVASEPAPATVDHNSQKEQQQQQQQQQQPQQQQPFPEQVHNEGASITSGASVVQVSN